MQALLNFWTKKPVNKKELNLKNTLINGQAFNWSQSDSEKFIGVLGNMVLQFGYDKNDNVMFQLMNKPSKFQYSRMNNLKDLQHILSTYFRLDQNLDELVNEWSKDKYFQDVGTRISGVRIFKQEPFECLISFIVSQNNNIKRITSNLISIREKFGSKLGTIENIDYYQFPSLSQLKNSSEQQLRDFGLGYRANYITELLKTLESKGGEKYLIELLEKDDDKKLEALLEFKGVGNKVADCVRLFSLECNSVVPVDTHVYQIYQNRYKSDSKKKVTSSNYGQVQELFKNKFGDYAGWAHSFLFTAELPQFKEAPKQTKESNNEKNTRRIKKTNIEEEQIDKKPMLKKKLKI